MKFQIPIRIPPLSRPICYTDHVLATGSCFTEHIAGRLAAHKFSCLQNPHGTLFNPLPVAESLMRYVSAQPYGEADLFRLDELWGSWAHHTRFSHTNRAAALEGINAALSEAAAFVRKADWIIITLGSAFQYFLKEGDVPVANNYRAPAALFEKRLLGVPQITGTLQAAIDAVRGVNAKARFLLTISPVRHIRDGVVDNNRSKARLIESVHALVEANPCACYFPAYELVIDVLRDYRYYDADLVHPNYAATEAVWEAFAAACISPGARAVMESVAGIVRAAAHRPRFPDTAAHRRFLAAYAQKVELLAAAHPYLNLAEEARYFHAHR